MPHLLAQLQQKITTGPQNKYHPELSENQAVWKVYHHGFKEATFTQTGRRGREAELCKEAQRHGMGGATSTCGG